MATTFFLVVHPDGTMTTVDRRLRSQAHIAHTALAILGHPRMEPVIRKAGASKAGASKAGFASGVTMAFRDPKDVCFEPMNPVLFGLFGVAARGPAVVLGTDERLHAFANAFAAFDKLPHIMPQRM